MPIDANKINSADNVFVNDKGIYNKPIQSAPTPQPNIGVDTDRTIYDNIIDNFEQGMVDLSTLESFTSVSQSRDQIYSLLDMMCEDPLIAAVLKAYAEDATEYNDNGQIVWAESSDSDVAKYVNFLLETMNVDKYAYSWVYSLAKYGDVYIRLFRQSDYSDTELYNAFNKDGKHLKLNETLNDIYTKENIDEEFVKNQSLQEDVKVVAYTDSDHYAHYVEMHSDPSEIFELTRHGKAYAYIKANINSISGYQNQTALGTGIGIAQPSNLFRYKFKSSDVLLYDPTEYVHACLEDVNTRTPEEVSIFTNDNDYDSNTTNLNYKVRRGQSLFYNIFPIWRELSLLQNSLILNRITKSAVIRVVGVEVGDMPKDKVKIQLGKIKQMMEQKAAISTGASLTEYTNPGPMENTVYIPKHGEIGNLDITTVGGDADSGKLDDVEYFRDLLFGALGIPKAFFGVTGDGAGFNGGDSLAQQSAQYAKGVKRLQNTLAQALTDAVNLMLIDKGLYTYVNKFTIKMQSPITADEESRREYLTSRVAIVRDVMDLVSDISDEANKLRILKVLLSNILTDTEITDILQEEIDKAEKENTQTETSSDTDAMPGDEIGGLGGLGSGNTREAEETEINSMDDIASDLGLETTEETGEESLPTPSELNSEIDFTDNTTEL